MNTYAFMQIFYNVLLNAIETSNLEGEIVITPWLEKSKQLGSKSNTLFVEV